MALGDGGSALVSAGAPLDGVLAFALVDDAPESALADDASASALVDGVVAHSGTTHAGTPHWLLGLLTLVGVLTAVGGWAALRRDAVDSRLGVGALAGGVVVTIAGTIGLVEIQVAPETTPAWTGLFPVINRTVAILVALGSLAVVRWRWPERPRYVGLGLLLAAWIGYPAMMPTQGVSHPLGYVVVLSVPVAVGYVLAVDGRDVLATAFGGRQQKTVAAVAFLLFAIFFAFSAGTLTVNPDLTPAIEGEGFVTTHQVESPLVYWPAIEFYTPSVPLAGYVSVGTVLLVSLLGGLVATNAGLVARQWAASETPDSPRAMLGTVVASGATACCCCAPAVYAAVGVLFGGAASPLYWAFMDPTSPFGGMFFAASVLILTGSVVRASHDPACRIPRSGESPEGVQPSA